MGGPDLIPPELEDLAAEVGEFICYWGFKKIHGRIWTHIYLSREPLDAGQLMVRLGVSKALISLSLNDLQRYDVIQDGPKSARGTQTYFANPDVLDVILNVIRRRERKMLARADQSHRLLSALNPDIQARAGVDLDRIESLGVIIGQAQNALTSLLELATVDLTTWELMNEGQKSGK